MRTTLFQISYSLHEIRQAAGRFIEATSGYTVFAFSGEMGAGKTTFIHHICDLLQVEDAVSSPTFALINEYHYTASAQQDKIIYHMDWYRLKDAADAINAGMEDCLDVAIKGGALCFIEWPEKAIELLPVPYLWISIDTIDIHERKMTIEVVS